MTLVAGADISKGRWAVVILRDGNFDRATITETIGGFLSEEQDLEIVAFDVPIGLPEGAGHRQCDREAKEFLKPRSASVFFTSPRDVLKATSYRKANELSWRKYKRGVSAQAYALGKKILEVDPIARKDERIVEAHPEVSFRVMKGSPLAYCKKSWGGQVERWSLLLDKGIDIPNDLDEAAEVPPDDILDAAAAAWTAWRVSEGEAGTLPESATGSARNRRGVIWY